jgi:hypothetical protein
MFSSAMQNQHNTTQHNTTQRNTTQHNTTHVAQTVKLFCAEAVELEGFDMATRKYQVQFVVVWVAGGGVKREGAGAPTMALQGNSWQLACDCVLSDIGLK